MVLSSAYIIFFKSSFLVVVVFSIFSVIPVEFQAVWIQIMPVGSDLGLNCCKGYQQTTIVSKEFMTKIQAN